MESNDKKKDVLNEINHLTANEKSAYRQIAGHNLSRIRDEQYPNKLSAMAATLQEKGFRDNIQPQDMERQLRRWMSNGLPIENISEIAKALDLPVTEFLVMLPSSQPSDMAFENIKKLSINSNDTQSQPDQPEAGNFHFSSYLKWITLFIVSGAVFLGASSMNTLLKPMSITIAWPDMVESNIGCISGIISNISNVDYSNLDIKLFVHPIGDTHYWLNEHSSPLAIKKNGMWFKRCRFGDEDLRTMKQKPPLHFDVYAAIIKKDAKFPLNNKQNFFLADSEKKFKNKLQPYILAISDRFIVTRVEPPKPDIPIVMAVQSPVKITWSEYVPMYLEIFHHGTLIKNGYFDPGMLYNLPPDQILYEIKLSRKKNYPQRNIWILVENKTKDSKLIKISSCTIPKIIQ